MSVVLEAIGSVLVAAFFVEKLRLVDPCSCCCGF